MSEDITTCPCCGGDGYFYRDEKPPSPWGDAAALEALKRENEALRADNASLSASLAAEVTESERLLAEVERKDAALRYLKRQAENGTLHNQVVIQNCAVALGDATLSPARKGEA